VSSNYKFAAGAPPSDRLRRRQGSFRLTRWWLCQMTFTLICFGRASSFFGNLTVSTLSLKSAVIRAASTRAHRAPFSKRPSMIAHERSASSWLIFPCSQVLTACCILDSSPFVSNSSIVLPTSFRGMK